MKNAFSLLSACAAFSALAAGSVGNVTVRQNWPWDNRVIIDYTLTGDADKTYDLALTLKCPDGTVTNHCSAIDGELLNVAPGTHRLVWSPAKAVNRPDETAFPFTFELTATEAASGGKYMVIDLSSEPYAVSYLQDVPSGGWTDEYKKSKLVLRRIQPGYFSMGSPTDEPGHTVKTDGNHYQETLHPVLLTNDYWIGVFPVTKKQYKTIYPADTTATADADLYPVWLISRYRLFGQNSIYNYPKTTDVEADSFFGTLSNKVGTAALPGYAFNLVTEAQWEYACRAGTQTGYYNGYNMETNAVGYDAHLDEIAWYKYNKTSAGRKNVGQKKPNAWGLYDMLGNIVEIVNDRTAWGGSLGTDFQVEPTGLNQPDSNCYQTCKGGANDTTAEMCRAAWRKNCGDFKGTYNAAFRVGLVRTRHNNKFD